MTTINLSHLTISDQLELLYLEGIYLSKRKTDTQTVLLYQFRTVYVEIFYLEYRKHVSRIIYTEDLAVLDPYLGDIVVDFFDN